MAAKAEKIELDRCVNEGRCEPKSGLRWVRIPSGSFEMGSNDGDSDERPLHKVQVNSFRMAESEVTVGQYRKCVEAGVCSNPHTGPKCNWGKLGRDHHPINCVDWGQARTFSRWVGGDLPTEAQWEYAARGGQTFKYAGSNDPDEVAWYDSNSGRRTHEVKTKRKNGYQLYDMSGNLWEWTLDKWHDNYRGAPNRGEGPWGDVPKCKIKCPNGSLRRMNRGGSWHYSAKTLRVAFRYNLDPDLRYNNLGFRPRRIIP